MKSRKTNETVHDLGKKLTIHSNFRAMEGQPTIECFLKSCENFVERGGSIYYNTDMLLDFFTIVHLSFLLGGKLWLVEKVIRQLDIANYLRIEGSYAPDGVKATLGKKWQSITVNQISDIVR